MQRTQNSQMIFKKNKVGALTFSNLKLSVKHIDQDCGSGIRVDN